MGELTRAGIPVDELAAHKDAADPWAAGAPYRARWEQAQADRLAGHWITEDEAKPWVYTEATYRSGKAGL